MSKPKLGKTFEGKDLHYSVGAIIKSGDKFLLMDRAKIPFGYAGFAGHIDENEEPIDAIKRELKEESNLDLVKADLLFEEELSFEPCSRGVLHHYWYVYLCEVEGEIKIKDDEVKGFGWFTKEEIKKLKLEKAWEYWLEKFYNKKL